MNRLKQYPLQTKLVIHITGTTPPTQNTTNNQAIKYLSLLNCNPNTNQKVELIYNSWQHNPTLISFPRWPWLNQLKQLCDRPGNLQADQTKLYVEHRQTSWGKTIWVRPTPRERVLNDVVERSQGLPHLRLYYTQSPAGAVKWCKMAHTGIVDRWKDTVNDKWHERTSALNPL